MSKKKDDLKTTKSKKPKRGPAKPKTSEKKVSEKKWGKPVMDLGYSIIPSLLFKAQRRLHLNPTQLTILMHLADFWWEPERKPYPSKQLLSDRINLGPRQIQRYIAELEEMGLVKRVARFSKDKGRTSNEYDLSGLVERLKEFAPQFQDVEAKVKRQRRAVEKPGLKNRKPDADDEIKAA